MTELRVLHVCLYGERIGTLTLLPGDQTLFVFDQEYIDNPHRPTMSLSFKNTLGELITDIRPTRTRVPAFFSNLLPEASLRDYLAKKAGVNPKREFFLLWALGCDLPGAITITPADAASWPPQEVIAPPQQQDATQALRFSLAGVQLKFSALQDAAGGLTIPASGIGGSWIVKLPSMKFAGVPENEYAMMKLAHAVGIEVPEVRLVPLQDIVGLPLEMAISDGNALAVKRFDRSNDGQPIHIEDFAQVFGLYPERKYERASYRNIAQVLWIETGEAGVAELVRRLVFNTLIGNADMHLKNFSLIYPDRCNALLAPGYDFVSTIAYIADTRTALTLGRSKVMTELSLDELAYFAAKAKLPAKLVVETGKETVRRFLDVWHNKQQVVHLEQNVSTPISQLLNEIPLVSEVG